MRRHSSLRRHSLRRHSSLHRLSSLRRHVLESLIEVVWLSFKLRKDPSKSLNATFGTRGYCLLLVQASFDSRFPDFRVPRFCPHLAPRFPGLRVPRFSNPFILKAKRLTKISKFKVTAPWASRFPARGAEEWKGLWAWVVLVLGGGGGMVEVVKGGLKLIVT